MNLHPIPEPGRTERREAFVNASRQFWNEYGMRVLDMIVIALVPTVIFAPALVEWLS